MIQLNKPFYYSIENVLRQVENRSLTTHIVIRQFFFNFWKPGHRCNMGLRLKVITAFNFSSKDNRLLEHPFFRFNQLLYYWPPKKKVYFER
jgi:hypothetical protein